MSKPNSWPTIATGSLARRLRVAIDDIAHALKDPAAIDDGSLPGLAHGSASLAIFYSYLSHAFPHPAWEDAMDLYLDRAIAQVATTKMTPGLFSGFSGVAWALDHLSDRARAGVEAGGGEPEPDNDVDDILVEMLEASPWSGEYDLVSGLVGYGVYALERSSSARRQRILALVIARLEELAVPASTDAGEELTWWTDPRWLPPHYAARIPSGEYNLGLAHGVPGIVAMLSAACHAGVAVERARPLLDGAMRWLRSIRIQAATEARYPHHIVPPLTAGASQVPARASWCYGDPGMALAFLGAARATGTEDWEHEALELGLLAARRPFAGSGVVDTGVCHGASGLALVFSRLYAATGEETFGNAAQLWLERTLELRLPGEAIAGFPGYRPQPIPHWQPAAGILEGAAGVALVMLSAIAPLEPSWDRFLLCSFPSPRRESPTW